MLDLHSSYGFSILEVSTWGQVFYASEIERTEKGQNWIHLYSFLGHILIFLRHAGHFFKHLGFDGVLCVRVKLTGMRGLAFQAKSSETIVSRFDDEIDVSLERPSEQFVGEAESVAQEIYRLVFFSVNWPAVADDDASLETLLKWANEYNGVG